jgi:hypothetical protein
VAKSNEIKIGFCVAYDWEFLKISLPLVYSLADKICLSLDKDRTSWTLQKFAFDDAAFYSFVKEADARNIIDIYEGDFHQTNLTPMQNEVRQRKLIATRLGEGGWHLQLDTDEYFVDFEDFVAFLKKYKSNMQVNITCPWYTMYKQVKNGCLFISENEQELEFIPIATRYPHYEFGRRNGYFNIKTPFVILHQSWARSEQEILQKISNWGHKEDFDVMQYYQRWQTLNETNFGAYQNFHPIHPEIWKQLEFREGQDLPTIIANLKNAPPFNIDKRKLRKENSVWRSRIKHYLSKIKNA